MTPIVGGSPSESTAARPMKDQPINTSDKFERRSFLGAMIGLISTAIAAFFGVTIARFSLLPSFSKSKEAGWIDLGKLADLPENKLIKKSITVAQEAGWGEFKAPRLLWVVRKGDEISIYSAVCPHLGCTVNAKEDHFLCACHGSEWSENGKKLAGPSPRNLDQLEHRIENNLLQVRYQDFKQGISQQEAI